MPRCKKCKKLLGRNAIIELCRGCLPKIGKKRGRAKRCVGAGCNNFVRLRGKLGLCHSCLRKRQRSSEPRCRGCGNKLPPNASTGMCRTCRSITGKEHGRDRQTPAVACATDGCGALAEPRSKLGLCNPCLKKHQRGKMYEPCTSCGKLRTKNISGLCRDCWLEQSVEDRGVQRWVYLPSAPDQVEIQDGVGLSARFAAKRKNAENDSGHTYGNTDGTD